MSHGQDTKPALTRRRMIKGVAASAAVAVLAKPNIARADPVPIVLGTNGGEEYKAMYEAVYAAFERKYNAKIVPVFGDGSTLLNRVIAEKARPSMDVTLTYQGGWLIGKAEGAFEKIDYANVPNADKMYDFLRDPDGYGPFCNFTAWGVCYNEETVKAPPMSFKDLWKPQYKGELMVGGIYHWQIHLAAFAYAWTGDQSKIDVAFDKMKQLAPDLAGFYGLTSDAQSKFQQGIAQMATWYSRTVQRLRNAGIPLRFQTPEEGAFIYPISYQAVKGTGKLDLVEKLIGELYDPKACVELARLNGYIPANREVKLPEELQKYILTYDQVLKCHNWDWNLINAQQDAWLSRWNAEVRPLLRG
ncbi:MAG: extracellular solute-binding protein [Hyphomicrobiales bacterium]